MFAGDPAPFVMELPAYHHSDSRQRSPFNVGAWLVIHQEGRYNHPPFNYPCLVHIILRLCRRYIHICSMKTQMDCSILLISVRLSAWIFAPLGWGNWQATVASITGLVAKENIVGTMGILYGSGDGMYGRSVHAFTGLAVMSFLRIQPSLCSLLCRYGCYQERDEQR